MPSRASASARAAAALALALAACGGEGGGVRVREGAGPWVVAPQGYAVRGSVEAVRGDSLRFRIQVRNPRGAPVRYTLAWCHVRVRAYTGRGRGGDPAWDSLRGEPVYCSTLPITRTLAPGDTIPASRWTLTVPVAEIVGDSLPPGTYHFTVSPPLEADPDDARAGFHVPAGSAHLPDLGS